MIRGDSFINIYAQVKVCSSKNENVTSALSFCLLQNGSNETQLLKIVQLTISELT